MSEWKEYTGSDEQIDELRNAPSKLLLRCRDGTEIITDPYTYPVIFTHYWLIPADPLREMKIRQAQTGQPVWVRWVNITCGHCVTTTPDWNIPNAEYSFTPFEDKP